jgi:hypothetical protein
MPDCQVVWELFSLSFLSSPFSVSCRIGSVLFNLTCAFILPSTVILEIGLTDTLLIILFWPHRQDLSADQILSGLHRIDGHRKSHLQWQR